MREPVDDTTLGLGRLSLYASSSSLTKSPASDNCMSDRKNVLMATVVLRSSAMVMHSSGSSLAEEVGISLVLHKAMVCVRAQGLQ